jgi:hypothetical protein
MSAAAVPAGIVPPRPAWRSLLWLISLTVLWIVLIYWQPAISTSGVPTTAVRLMTYGLIAVGLWLGLESTDLTPGQRRATWLAVMIPYTLWMAVAWSGAINGVFRTGTRLPALPLAIFLPVIIGAPLLLLSKRVGQVLDAIPGELARRSSALPRIRRLGSRCRAEWGAARRVRRAGGNWRYADWPVRRAGGDRRGNRHGSGTEGRDRLEHFRPRRFRRRDHSWRNHLARPVPVDRSGCAEHRRRRLSGCADPCFRGAKLDPAARVVAAPADPTTRRLISLQSFDLPKDNSSRMGGWSNVR